MVEMTVGENQSQKLASALQTVNLWMERGIIGIAVEWQAKIKQNARALRLQFDTASADLLGSPVYSDPHRPSMDAETSTLAGTINTFMWLLPVVF
ncbi:MULTISPECIES: hypothetical protein [unclassified Shinella]|uniref:hypothetical protein n=1 Tax=unclassified Shinella TaxID=2643062 RepID=UPI001FDA2FF9|nr:MULTISPECIES: hypothetical protein [unclassified Shinella]